MNLYEITALQQAAEQEEVAGAKVITNYSLEIK